MKLAAFSQNATKAQGHKGSRRLIENLFLNTIWFYKYSGYRLPVKQIKMKAMIFAAGLERDLAKSLKAFQGMLWK